MDIFVKLEHEASSLSKETFHNKLLVKTGFR